MPVAACHRRPRINYDMRRSNIIYVNARKGEKKPGNMSFFQSVMDENFQEKLLYSNCLRKIIIY